MRIERVEITVKVDLSGTPDYDGPVERGQMRRFRPQFAMVLPHGDAHVFGHRVSARGVVSDRRSVILYPADQDVPEYVRAARVLAGDYRALAHDAWQRLEMLDDRQSV